MDISEDDIEKSLVEKNELEQKYYDKLICQLDVLEKKSMKERIFPNFVPFKNKSITPFKKSDIVGFKNVSWGSCEYIELEKSWSPIVNIDGKEYRLSDIILSPSIPTIKKDADLSKMRVRWIEDVGY